jgi:hypothetical protein
MNGRTMAKMIAIGVAMLLGGWALLTLTITLVK